MFSHHNLTAQTVDVLVIVDDVVSTDDTGQPVTWQNTSTKRQDGVDILDVSSQLRAGDYFRALCRQLKYFASLNGKQEAGVRDREEGNYSRRR